MTTTKTPTAPTGLGARGRAFWRATVEGFDLERGELELLAEVAHMLDEIDELTAALARDGVLAAGSTRAGTRAPGDR